MFNSKHDRISVIFIFNSMVVGYYENMGYNAVKYSKTQWNSSVLQYLVGNHRKALSPISDDIHGHLTMC